MRQSERADMPIDHAVGVQESDLPWVDIAVRPGYRQRYQGFFDKARGIGARVGSLYAEPYYHSPRHRHTFQQVRYLVSGKMRYQHEIYRVGDCLYLPEGVHYGPVKPIEGNTEQMHFVDIQFVGPSGIVYPDPEDVVRAQRELAAIGTFDEGIYVDPAGRKRDGYEAILERITGHPIEYPTGRLTDYVVMRSTAYPWSPYDGAKGVQLKHLAYFFEIGPNIKMVSIEAGNALPGGRAPGHQARFLLSGSVDFHGKTLEALSYFMLPMGEEYGPLHASSDAELLIVTWAPTGSAPLPFTPL
jgi:hypothetical protein